MRALLGALMLGLCSAENNWPIVAVFTLPSHSSQGSCKGDCVSMAASYVKYLESAGARVVPVNYNAPTEELDTLFDSVNGWFFTGGGASLPPSAKHIWQKVKTAKDSGDYLPLWGTCLGFEWLLKLATNDTLKLDPLDAENISLSLNLTSDASSSELFGEAPTNILEILQRDAVTMNNHHYGGAVSTFNKNKELNGFFNLLSSNLDRKGVEFASTIEAKEYPIFGTQWHPEKNNFEWQKVGSRPYEGINHSRNAVAVSQYTADFFVSRARLSNHSFADPEKEKAALIWNYAPVATTGDFVQTYYFPKDFKSI